jgi:hypothetical protein
MGAAAYLAVLAYPAPDEWPKRDRFVKASKAWMLRGAIENGCPKGRVKDLYRKMRPREIKSVMNHAFWRIDARRDRAADIATAIVTSIAFGGRLRNLLPGTVRQALGAKSADDTDKIADSMHHVWAESLPVLHLSKALPGGRTGWSLISDPSWVADSLGRAEKFRRIFAPFLARNGCKAVRLLPS